MLKIMRLTLITLLLVATFTIKAQKIVTAGSSATEIVCSLGLCDNIIATDRTSTFPPHMQGLTSIGYRTGITAEGIIAMAPDFVVLEKDYVKPVVVEQLQSAKIKIVEVENLHNFENTLQRIQTIATALNKATEGKELIAELKQGQVALAQKVAAAKEQPTILCVFNRGVGNMMVAGKTTGFDIINLAGLASATPTIEGYKPLNTEALITANPDYILFFESGLESIGGKDAALKVPGVAQTTAGKKGQIIALDGVALTNWGPRVIETAQKLFDLTHN
ncbi:ABC transporter substrate-binding protein [Roseivirga pacifica]|nr:ABC transporter substrate-binding protein [Roseivirga pacifica]MCO6366255.1 ABC transporter substrate-binding protein [Roseivirga pacifica]MCO6374012.1 ABC transporter substrate-binding protein [Roseivirga pacifica]MCO6378388.1 ABC transporter substrate-binding protein [Roseivirga pacifica]